MNGGFPVPGLIDTSIVLEIRSGTSPAHEFALAILRHAGIEMSELSAMALLARCRETPELEGEIAFVRNCKVHRITAPISKRALRILETLPPPSPLTADNAIVAATALEHKLPLYTLDPPRFAAVPGLSALPPY